VNCKEITDMTKEDMFHAIETHIEDGVDFIQSTAGVTRQVISALENHPRTIG